MWANPNELALALACSSQVSLLVKGSIESHVAVKKIVHMNDIFSDDILDIINFKFGIEPVISFSFNSAAHWAAVVKPNGKSFIKFDSAAHWASVVKPNGKSFINFNSAAH